MPVAPSFENFEIVSEIFLKNSREYIKVKNPKTNTVREVRWYTQKEKDGTFKEKSSSEIKVLRCLREVRGFTKGYITIVRNNGNKDEDYLITSTARYAVGMGWYFISDEPIPTDIPEHFELINLLWEEVCDENKMGLRPADEIKKIIDAKTTCKGGSEYQGAIGDVIAVEVEVIDNQETSSKWKGTLEHTFEDKDGNIYVWITQAKNLPIGKNYQIEGKVKDHLIKDGVRQTIINYCKAKEIE